MSDSFQQPKQENALPVLHPLPLQRNPYFTGYDALLASLPQRFEQTPTLLLSGYEGIGKTQIAQEYACRFAEHYETILWLTSSSRAMLSHDLSQLINWPVGSRSAWKGEDPSFAFLKDWLQTHPTWLLVLDHLGDFSLLDLIIPPNPQGHLLLTTRQTFAQLSALFSQSPSVLSEATRSLLQHAQTLVIGPSPAQPAQTLADRLPSQTIRFLSIPTLGVSLTKAIAVFEQRQAAFQEEHDGPREAFRHHDAALLLEEFTAFWPLPLVSVLRLLVFLPPVEAMVQGEADHEIPEPLASLLADPPALELVLSDLEKEELLSRQGEDRRIQLHAGLGILLRESLTQEEHRVWTSLGRRVFTEYQALRISWEDRSEPPLAPQNEPDRTRSSAGDDDQ
jgi:hypothetical protein